MKRYLFLPSAVVALAVGLVAAPASMAKPADLPSQNGIECPDGSDDPVKGKFSIELDITSKGITLKLGAGLARPEPTPALDAFSPALINACVEQLVKYVGDVWTTRQQREANAERTRGMLEARLFEPVNVRIKNVPLQQALKNLAHASGVRIVPDRAALEEAKVNLDSPVSLAVENTSVHTALQQLLRPMRLTFEIENDMVKVTTPDVRPDRIAAAKNEHAHRLFEIAERHRRASEYNSARRLYQQVHLLTPTTIHGRMAIVRIIDIEERMRDAAEEQQNIPGRPDDPEQVYRDMRDRSVPLGLVEVSY